MTVLTRARRVTGLTHRLGLRTNLARSPRPAKIRKIGAALVAVVLSLGLATPANAASVLIGFNCYHQTGTDYWCNPYETAGHTVLAYAGLYNGNGHDYTLSIENHSATLTIELRVVADNGRVIDYHDYSSGTRITYGIQRIYVWVVGYALSPAVNVQ